MERRAKVELFEQIRRESEFGITDELKELANLRCKISGFSPVNSSLLRVRI